MFMTKSRHAIIAAALLALCAVLAACGASEEKEINCVIGVTAVGNAYTATVHLSDADWAELTQRQRESVVDQCIDTVEFSREEGEPDYELTGIDRDTGKRLFTYTSEDEQTTFIELEGDRNG